MAASSHKKQDSGIKGVSLQKIKKKASSAVGGGFVDTKKAAVGVGMPGSTEGAAAGASRVGIGEEEAEVEIVLPGDLEAPGVTMS